MRLVEGTTLSELLERIRQKDGPTLAKYPLRSLLTIFQKVCDAVAFAHSRGVIPTTLIEWYNGSGRSVCLSQQPVEDEGVHPAGVLPEAL